MWRQFIQGCPRLDTLMETGPGEEMQRRALASPAEPGMVVKKCRICFQAERIAIRRESAQGLQKGKGIPSPSIWERLRHWIMGDHHHHPTRLPAAGGGGADGDLAPGGERDDGFVSPCRCSGSMAWVHKSCLRLWRNRSPRRDSFYQCEQCFTAYRFRQTLFSRVLSGWVTVKLITVLTVALSFVLSYLFVAGLIPGDQYADYDWAAYDSMRPTVQRGEGIFAIDGTYVGHFDQYHIPTRPPPSRGRWTTRTADGAGIGVKITATATIKASTSPTDKAARRAQTRDGEGGHSLISYLNIGYWLSGHSLDEWEDSRNDFLSAILDLHQLKLWVAAFILLSIVAYIREGSRLACVMATFLLVTSVAWLVNGWEIMIWATPMPAFIGFWKYVVGVEETVEAAIDTVIKMTAYELENYVEPESQ